MSLNATIKTDRYKNKTDLCEDLAELGWDYSCGRMSRSGMFCFDQIMTRLGASVSERRIGDTTFTKECRFLFLLLGDDALSQFSQ